MLTVAWTWRVERVADRTWKFLAAEAEATDAAVAAADGDVLMEPASCCAWTVSLVYCHPLMPCAATGKDARVESLKVRLESQNTWHSQNLNPRLRRRVNRIMETVTATDDDQKQATA